MQEQIKGTQQLGGHVLTSLRPTVILYGSGLLQIYNKPGSDQYASIPQGTEEEEEESDIELS